MGGDFFKHLLYKDGSSLIRVSCILAVIMNSSVTAIKVLEVIYNISQQNTTSDFCDQAGDGWGDIHLVLIIHIVFVGIHLLILLCACCFFKVALPMIGDF